MAEQRTPVQKAPAPEEDPLCFASPLQIDFQFSPTAMAQVALGESPGHVADFPQSSKKVKRAPPSGEAASKDVDAQPKLASDGSCALCDDPEVVNQQVVASVVCDTCGHIHHVSCLRSLAEAKAVVPSVNTYVYVCSRCAENSFHWIAFGKANTRAFISAVATGVTLNKWQESGVVPSAEAATPTFTLKEAVAWIKANPKVGKRLTSSKNPRTERYMKDRLEKANGLIEVADGAYRLLVYPVFPSYTPTLKKRLKSEFTKKPSKKRRNTSSVVRGSRGAVQRPRGLLYAPKVSVSPNQQLIAANSAQEMSVSKNSASSTGGYRSARAAWPLRASQCGYFEVVIPESFLGHCRVGWSLLKMNLEGPVGFDKFSFGVRDVDCSTFHGGLGSNPLQGCRFGAGDVVGCLLSLQEENTFLSCVKNGAVVVNRAFLKAIPPGNYFPTLSLFSTGDAKVRVTCNFGPEWKVSPPLQALGVEGVIEGRGYVRKASRKSSAKRAAPPAATAVSPTVQKELKLEIDAALLPPVGKTDWSFDEDYALSMMICVCGAHRPVTKMLDEQWFYEKHSKDLAHIHPQDIFLRYLKLIPLIKKWSTKIEGGNFRWLLEFRESQDEQEVVVEVAQAELADAPVTALEQGGHPPVYILPKVEPSAAASTPASLVSVESSTAAPEVPHTPVSAVAPTEILVDGVATEASTIPAISSGQKRAALEDVGDPQPDKKTKN